MNRWKHEARETIILMHRHNQWSRWNDALLTAAEAMGLPVSKASYPNGSGDGSWDTEWYTCAAVLARLGGRDALYSKAEELSL